MSYMFKGAKTAAALFTRVSTIAARGLHLHKNERGEILPQVPELLITNGWAAKLGVLHAMRLHEDRHGMNCHQDFKLITQPTWITKIAGEYKDFQWGQKIRDFPPELQAIIRAANPTRRLSPGDFPTITEMGQLERYVEQELKEEYGAEIIHGTVDPKRIAQVLGGIEVPYSSTDFSDKSLIVPNDTYFLYFCRNWKKFDMPGGARAMDAGKMFEMSKEQLPPVIVVFGTGLAAAWSVIAHPDITHVVLMNPDFPIRKTQFTGDWDERSNVIMIDMKEEGSEVTSIADGVFRVESPRLKMGAIEAPGFSSLGSFLPINQLPSFIPVDRRVEAGDASFLMTNFVAPKSLPPDSLPRSHAGYMAATGNLHKRDVNLGIITQNNLIEVISQHAKEKGLVINDDVMKLFTGAFRKEVGELHHAVDNREYINMLEKHYVRCEPDSLKKDAFEKVSAALADDYARRVGASSAWGYKTRIAESKGVADVKGEEADDTTTTPTHDGPQ